MVNQFVELDENSVVVRTIVAGHVEGSEGEQWCASVYGGIWKQSDTEQRRHAEPGFTYIQEHDVFVSPKPFPSWSLDANFLWTSPIPYPQDGKVWAWNESTLSWEFVRDN